MKTSKGYILFTGNMPMSLEPQTMDDVNRAYNWQLRGQGRPSEYQIGELFSNGEIINIDTKETITPEKGCYKEEYFDSFITHLNQMRGV